jgi:thiol-disulfide isomerase/thioredoxin
MKQLIAIVLTLTCLTTNVISAAPVKAGQPMPALTKLIPGAKIPSTKMKLVLVDFWASWCAPCKQAFPCLNRLQASYKTKGLVVIGVGVDEKAVNFKSFAAKMKAKFPLVHDSGHRAAAAFGPSTMPTSYLVDRNGIVRYVHNGFKGAKTEAKYIAEIEALLAKGR